MKRLMDLVLVVLAAPVWVPLLLLTALVVRIKLGSPVFFRQQRPGLLGAPFVLFKFRSMREVRDEAGKLLPDEERLTTFGHLIRRTSLDELPELINVLKGEMSLVGPRPLLMRYLPRYSPEQARRHAVLPGITGWAQVNGRNAISWDEKFKLDVWYVDHRSIGLDMVILFRTFLTVISSRGVHAPGSATMPEFMGSSNTPSKS